MADALQTIWSQCLSILKDTMQNTMFEAYIVPLKLLDLQEDTAHFEVPMPFYVSTLETKFCTQIRDAITAVTQKEYRLQFHLPNEYKTVQTPKLVASSFVSHLNPKYTFDSFIIGNSNRMAYAAAVAISGSPGTAYNPFFIYGQSGLGKTHLMHAIGNQILEDDPTKKVLYVTSETFTNEFLDAITHKTNEEFRNKYRKIDVLLIDDIQFISQRERTQEEFFYTFNALYEEGKQIVVSCDRPLNEINILAERLRTRFAWGLIADVQTPDFETKIAILRKKAYENSIEIEDEIADYIAHYTGDNIRELEGVINHLRISLSQGKEINMTLAKEALRHLQSNDVQEVTAGVIIDVVSRYFNVRVDELLSKKKNKELAFPRQISMYLCRVLTELSFPKIAAAFNRKDHTTVMYAYEQISNQVEINPELKSIMEELKLSIVK